MRVFEAGNQSKLSYWEQNQWFDQLDFVVVGGGLVGSSAAFHLRKQYPSAKILVLERGLLPAGASTKNAGFACFGSATELLDDLSRLPEQEVWETVRLRYEGLAYLRGIVGDDFMDFQRHGSWDLIARNEHEVHRKTLDQLDYLNSKMTEITGEKQVFTWQDITAMGTGFSGLMGGFYNRLEGQIDTGRMMRRWMQLLVAHDVQTLTGIAVEAIEPHAGEVLLQTNLGVFRAGYVCVCTNGFAGSLFPALDVRPARAQVLITKPIPNLRWKGTFHVNAGYYYFRNIDNRILLGGGRNLDFEGETTTELATTTMIQSSLESMLRQVICPDQPVEIDRRWAGIMGVGGSKKPIVERVAPRITVGVRMGGMGVAIGSLVGKKVAEISG